VEANPVVGRYLYLYALFRPPPRVGEPLFTGLPDVEDGSEIAAIECRDLAMAATPVPGAIYNQENLDLHRGDLEWLGVRAARHEQVVRRLMQSRDVVPLKFATLYTSRERVEEVLESRYREFTCLLERIAGREEWGVKVYADVEQIGRACARSEADLIPKRIAAASAGEAYFLQKKKQKRIAEEARQWAADARDAIYATLLRSAVECRRTRFLHPAPPARELPVLSAALLVGRGQAAHLQAAAERLEALYRAERLRIELSGPWAPYHFCEEP
jgi:hypothetical protein